MGSHQLHGGVHCTVVMNSLQCVVFQETKEAPLTNARDPIARVSCVTRAVERALGVGTVGVSVAVVCVMIM